MSPTLIADTIISTLSGIGAILAIIGVAGGKYWSDGNHSGMWHHQDDYVKNEYQTTRACSIFGAICSVGACVVSIIRLRVASLAKSKSLRLVFVCTLMSSFLCLLTAIAVWGDFASHGTVSSVGGRTTKTRLHLGWAFWVSVVADIVLFIANLLYLMRKDFKNSEQRQAERASEKDNFVHT